MVHCDGCGTAAGLNDEFCRVCGRILTRLPATPDETGDRKRDSESTYHDTVAQELQGFDLDLVMRRKEALSAVSSSCSEAAKPERDEAVEDELLKKRLKEFLEKKEAKEESGGVLGKVWKKPPLLLVSLVIAGLGLVSLLLSLVFATTVLAFIGLGLTFWGLLLLFIRPRKYVRSDLLDSTVLSSLKTVDRVITEFGYSQRAIYLPRQNPEKVIAFVPQNALTDFSKLRNIKEQTFIEDPKGISIIPPGLELSNLIERELGIEFGKTSLETLSERLSKFLTEDLEIFRNFEMKVEYGTVQIKFEEPIYSELCKKLRDCTSICSSLGCPICSAMACVLAQTSGKPVTFYKDVLSSDGRTTECSYMIFEN